MEYKPSFRAFIGSFFYGLTPLLTASVVTYFMYQKAGWWLWVLDGLMALLCLHLSVQCIFVYLHRLSIDDQGIRMSGPLRRAEIRWGDVLNATLRERVNPVSRTDRLLIIKARHNAIAFNTSTLSEADDDAVLAEVRAHTPLVVQRDKPSI